MRAAPISIAILLGCGQVASAQAVGHLTFLENGQQLTLQPGTETEVGIDSVLGMRWDHPALLQLIASKTGRPGTSPLVEDIKVLVAAIQAATLAQEQLIAYKVRFAALQAARLAQSPQLAAIQKVERDASVAYGKAGLQMIEALRALEARRPAMASVIDRVVLQGDDYDPVIVTLTEEVRAVQDALANTIAQGGRVQILMTATLIDSGGRPTALHLPGYDTIALGAPTPFARFNLTLDQRAMAELNAAAAFAPLATSIQDGSFTREVKKALDDLPAAFKDLKQSLSTGPVAKEIDATVAELKAAGTDEAASLATSFEQLKSALNNVDAGLAAPAGAAETLAQTASRLMTAIANVRTAVVGLPEQLERLVARADPILKARKTATADALVKTLKGAADEFLKQHAGLLTIQQNLQEASRSLSLTNELSNAAEAASRTALAVQSGARFDTSLDLTTVRAERHPGDRVHVNVEVNEVATDGTVRPIEHDRRTFRLEQRGFYSEARGALLFAEPQGTIGRDVSFQPAPAVGFQIRYGFAGMPFLNHVLAPSIGISMTLLDFEDDPDFELGVALNATMLRSILWMGAGRNLQAEANYWYVGINPLALSGLLRR